MSESTSYRGKSLWAGLLAGSVLGAALAFGVFYVPHRGLPGLGWASAGDTLQVHALFAEAQGLRIGSPVEVLGIDAGRVRGLHVVEVPGWGTRVSAELTIDAPERFGARLTDAATVQIRRSALLGEVVVAITPRAGGTAWTPGRVVAGQVEASTEQLVADVAAIATRLRDFVDGDKPGDPSLRRTLVHLEETLRRLRDFADHLPE